MSVPAVGITAESAANAAGWQKFGASRVLDVVISGISKLRENGPKLFSFPVGRRSLRERGISRLVGRRMELWRRPVWTVRKFCLASGSDGGNRSQHFQEALTLLELLPGLPPERTVGIVEPLAIAGQEVGVSLRERESMLVAAEQRVAAQPALVPTTNEEWGKIGAELLRRKIVVETDLCDEPVEDYFWILFWLLDVVKSGVPAPLASLMVRLLVNAIPSSSLQRRILVDEKKIAKGDEWLNVCLENEMIFLGDGEEVPRADEWFYVCLGENGMIFWSSGDIFGRFRVFSVAFRWRKRMILSKPIRQPVEGSTGNGGVDRRCGGNAPRDHPSSVRVGRVWLAVAVTQMGWLSAVGKVQHLHRRLVTSKVLLRGGLDPSAELFRGKPFLMIKPPPPSLSWSVYVDNFDIGEIMSKNKGRKLVGKPSMSKILYKNVFAEYEVPRAKKESVMRSEKANTMGFVGDGLPGIALPGLTKLLEYVALTASVLSAGRVPPVWVQVNFGRWMFDFQHRLPCFGALSSIWAGTTQWLGKKSITDRSNDELYLCVEVLQLLFRRCSIRIARRSFAAYASETGAGICSSTGVIKHGLKQSIIKRVTEEHLTADDAATSLVHRFFRRSLHLGTDVMRILVCRSVRMHGHASQLLRRSELGGLLKLLHELTAGGTKTSEWQLIQVSCVLTSRPGLWLPDWGWWKAAYPGNVALASWPGLWLPDKWWPVTSVIWGQIGGGGEQPI